MRFEKGAIEAGQDETLGTGFAEAERRQSYFWYLLSYSTALRKVSEKISTAKAP
jgi:uncharacterized protein (DUF488 family)